MARLIPENLELAREIVPLANRVLRAAELPAGGSLWLV